MALQFLKMTFTLCVLLGTTYVNAFSVFSSASLTRRSAGTLRTRTSTTFRMATSSDFPPAEELSTDQSFEEAVLKSKMPVFVDFHAKWCAPCMLLAPYIDEMADTYKGKLKVLKVNCDEHKDLTKEYKVRGLPLLALFKDGKIVARHEGMLYLDQIEKKMFAKKLPEVLS